MNTKDMKRIRIWDLPIRIFHWVLIPLLVALFLSAYSGKMAVHAKLGQVVLILVASRVVWGFVGSQTARFSQFVMGLPNVLAYLRNGRPRTLGHNPLGALMIIALLCLLALQAISGLFGSNGLGFDGPFAHLLSRSTVDVVTEFHTVSAYVLAAAIAVHVSAIVWHWVAQGENLIPPMWNGTAYWPSEVIAPRLKGAFSALLVLVLIATLWFIIRAIT